MDKKNLMWHGILSSTLASIAGIIYFEVYQYLMFSSFDSIVNWGSITGASTLGCFMMMFGYWLLLKFNLVKWIGWMNVLITILSFASIFGAINTALPLEIDFPELFPGLVVPMHFFPAISFFGIAPFFMKIKTNSI